jgi:hypothetical protein
MDLGERAQMIRGVSGTCLVLLLVGPPLLAVAERSGEEIRVNVITRSKQALPGAVFDGASAIVVWESPEAGILGRRLALDSAGDHSSEMVLVPSLPASESPGRRHLTAPREPALASDGQGGLYLLWTRERTVRASIPFLGRRKIIDRDVLCGHFGSDGTPLGPAKQVHSNGIGWQDQPRVERLADGSLFVLWHSDDRDKAASRNDGLFGRVLDADCSPRGQAFLVSDPLAGRNAVHAALAAAADRMAVAWEQRDNEGTGVFRRFFDLAGAPLDAPARLDDTTGGRAGTPSIAHRSGVGYLVLWRGESEEGRRTRIYGRLLSEQGEPTGDEITVSEGEGEREMNPSVVAVSGAFFAIWVRLDRRLPAALQGVELDASGTPIGVAEAINTFEPGEPQRAFLVSDGRHRLLAAWEGYFERQRSPGISAQFVTIEP